MSDKPNRADTGSKRQPWKLLGVLSTALLVAVVTTIGTNLGSGALDLFDDEPPPITYSAQEGVHECGTGLFVRGDRATGLSSGKLAVAVGWEAFKRTNHAIVADRSVVEVSIQGETSRAVTLTRIDFMVNRRSRPTGKRFSLSCGGPIEGRFVKADLDKSPPAVVSSTENPKGSDGTDASGRIPFKPIRFPWTVSVTDPLLLQLVATTDRCFCVWRAEIPWISGSQSGVMRINNHGKGYSVVGSDGVTHLVRDRTARAGWRRVGD